MVRVTRRAFTIVELLVVIAIIGILISLLMPAVQAARESVRQSTCKSNLRQMGIGVAQHVSLLGRFPTGGWGWSWVGDPDMGNGREQPGGWIYNILPYIDQQALHDYGAGGVDPSGNAVSKSASCGTRMATPLAMFYCPLRRPVMAYPGGYASAYNGVDAVGTMARTDYTINNGDNGGCQIGPGPGDASNVNWYGTSDAQMFQSWTGVSYQQSMIQTGHILDGMAYTLLIGEKYLDPDNYKNGADGRDNENMYVGFDNDTGSSTAYQPMQDVPGYGNNTCLFGSAHPGVATYLMCDGSSRSMSYGIDLATFKSLGNRSDGMAIDDAKLK